jgi:hypothetical protein
LELSIDVGGAQELAKTSGRNLYMPSQTVLAREWTKSLPIGQKPDAFGCQALSALLKAPITFPEL